MIDFNAFSDEMEKIAATRLQKVIGAGKLSFDDAIRVVRGRDVRSRMAVHQPLIDAAAVNPKLAPELRTATKKLLHEENVARKARNVPKGKDSAVGKLQKVKRRRLEREGYNKRNSAELATDEVRPYADPGGPHPLKGLKGRLARLKSERAEKTRVALADAQKKVGKPRIELNADQQTRVAKKIDSVVSEAKPAQKAKPAPSTITPAPKSAPSPSTAPTETGMPTYAKAGIGILGGLGAAGIGAHVLNRARNKAKGMS